MTIGVGSSKQIGINKGLGCHSTQHKKGRRKIGILQEAIFVEKCDYDLQKVSERR